MIAIATLDLDADLADQPTGLPASLRGATPQPAPEALEAPEPSLPATPRPATPRPLWLRREAELTIPGSDASEVLEGEPGADLSTMPPISARDPQPISVRIPTVPPAPQVSAAVVLEEEPTTAELRELRELRTQLVAWKAEIAAERGGGVREVLDSHERTEAAKERARVEAEHWGRRKAKWDEWLMIQLGRLFVAITLAVGYIWGDTGTKAMIAGSWDTIVRWMTGGAP